MSDLDNQWQDNGGRARGFALPESTAGYCAGCGERKPLRWGHDTFHYLFCSRRCAADFGFAVASSGGGYCYYCGDLGCRRYHDDGAIS